MNVAFEEVWSVVLMMLVLFVFIGIPVLLTLFHMTLLFVRKIGPRLSKWRAWLEIVTVFLGIFYSLCYAMVSDICFDMDWPEQLYNSQVHTPVATWSVPTVVVFAIMGVVGYLILRLVPLRKMPPLVVVTGISFTYAGILVAILWCIQVGAGIWLALFPANCILLALIQIESLILQWREMQEEEKKTFKNAFLRKCCEKLDNSFLWPVAAFVLFLPILGILVGILTLFGQSPDAVIIAFTQTSDWMLSKEISPQNLTYDEHYLCTVAAGGHRSIVKPQHMGIRHGHSVIVNRQLCIANAFEQILEERTPRFHRGLRHFYDTYGFPVAKLIRSPYAADVIYFLMKPLEWIFLITIYFYDVKPENRIAVQYLPAVKDKQ